MEPFVRIERLAHLARPDSPRHQRWIMQNSYDTNNNLRYSRMVQWKLEPLLPVLSTTVSWKRTFVVVVVVDVTPVGMMLYGTHERLLLVILPILKIVSKSIFLDLQILNNACTSAF
jgi:hypothetical protein